ncbi:MAG: NACHT domain-containing protein, partial [Geminicoccaceae bacterium]
EARRSSDALRVVTGGPGSGKSSSALWFARDVAYAGSANVFVIRLQGLDVDRPIDAVIKDFVAFSGSDHGMLEESPIDWLRDDPKPLLLVFDGLDEVARPDGEGLEVTKTFLRTLHTRLGQANRDVEARITALALGRPHAAEEAALAMGGSLGDQALLHVVSLSRMDRIAFIRLGERWNIGWNDPKQLADEDFRATFYERYRPFDETSNGGGTPEALGDDDLAEMTTEPLLLYLLIISGYAGEDWKLAKENRNRVYQRIFQGIHERDLKKPVGHPSKMGIERAGDFFALMECLGLAAWLGGGRSGSDEDFALIRDETYLPERAGEFRDLASAKLDNVALQTFTHRNDREKPGYAFIHKSFGEYLTGRALVEASAKWCEDYGKRNRWDQFAEDWLRLAGGAHLTPEILAFIVDEVRLRPQRRLVDEAEMKTSRRLVGYLGEAVTLTLRDGFPAHGELPRHSKSHWRLREAWQRNAEEALYALLHAWARVAYPIGLIGNDRDEEGWSPGPIAMAWPDSTVTPARAMIARLRDQWGIGSILNALFARWSFPGQHFGIIDLILFPR